MKHLFLLVLACLHAGCGGNSEQLAQTTPSADTHTNRLARAAKENDIRETVLRYGFNQATSFGKWEVCYLSAARVRHAGHELASPDRAYLPPLRGIDPSVDFVGRFKGHRPPVKGVSHCTHEKGTWYLVDKSTGRKGCVFWTGTITWVGAAQVDVVGGHDLGKSHASEYMYRVICERGRWIVKDAKLLRARGTMP